MVKDIAYLCSKEFKKLPYKQQLIIVEMVKRELEEQIEKCSKTIERILEEMDKLARRWEMD